MVEEDGLVRIRGWTALVRIASGLGDIVICVSQRVGRHAGTKRESSGPTYGQRAIPENATAILKAKRRACRDRLEHSGMDRDSGWGNLMERGRWEERD